MGNAGGFLLPFVILEASKDRVATNIHGEACQLAFS
nr:MAG TPA: hypothetical protein [Caudoviricetes sp.]